jgi:hypothetical protein
MVKKKALPKEEGHPSIRLNLVPRIVHVVRIVVVFRKEIRDSPEIIEIDIVAAVGFHWIALDLEAQNLKSHMAIIMEVTLDNAR